MDKLDSLNQVAEFHKTFNAPILDTPQIPSKERADLRVSLLQEELDELKKAIEDNDLVEVADALCDLQYVLSGAVLEFGLGEKFVELFNEVQRSNMSKACDNEIQAGNGRIL
jgi:predicted HAD superfamily Cof-like phosphohydrolase